MEQRRSKDVTLLVGTDDCQVHRVSTDLSPHPHVVDRNGSEVDHVSAAAQAAQGGRPVTSRPGSNHWACASVLELVRAAAEIGEAPNAGEAA